ncbi:DUF6612 family protein [Bacillus sp. JCM 19041]|uniref:DUF6612 family protein n=1 Tax=Bacillus sp. JCM 19041 TaxID=1460637 RepID=UPI0006D0696B
MKKMTGFMLIPFTTLMLVACGSDNNTEDANTDAETGAGEQEEAITAADVLAKTTEAMEEVNSLQMDLTMDYIIDADGEQMEMGLAIQADAIQEPLALSMNTTVSSPEMGMDFLTSQYIVDGIFYMQNPLGTEWFMIDMSDDLSAAEEMQLDTQEQLAMMQDLSEHITLKEDDDFYVLHVEGANEELNELVLSFMEMGQEDMGLSKEELAETMELFELENMTYTIYVNKETFYQKKMEMSYDVIMEEEGTTINMTGNAEGTYSSFNEIEEIEIPQEALDNAIDASDFGDELLGDLDLEEDESQGEE